MVLHCSASCGILSFLSVAGENGEQDPYQDNKGTMIVAFLNATDNVPPN